MDLQTNREVAAQEDLLQKADLHLNLTEQESMKRKVLQSIDIEFEGTKKPAMTEGEKKPAEIVTEKKSSETDSEKSQTNSDSNQSGPKSVSRRA